YFNIFDQTLHYMYPHMLRGKKRKSLSVWVQDPAIIRVDIDEPVSEGSVPGPGALHLHPFVHFSEGFHIFHVPAGYPADNVFLSVFVAEDPDYEVLVPVMGQHHRGIEHQRR